MTISKELATRLKAFRFDDLPEDAVAWAKIGILDTVAVTLAGAHEDCVRIAEKVNGAQDGPSLIFGQTRRAGPLDAAFLNGIASHALDFDDLGQTIGGHPSVPLVPAIIALGEAHGSSGQDMITAYVAGFEAQSAIARAANFYHYERGWHPTATLGIFGTVAASACMLDLSEEQTATALSVAVSLASGVKANFGSMTKPLHVGQMSRNGVMAALLARDGFTAEAKAFEHHQGFFNVFNGPGNFDMDRIFENWGAPLDIVDPGLGLKQFPCCGCTHAAINCMLELGRGGLKAEDVAEIEILVHPRCLPHTNEPAPQTGLEGKFSIQYTTVRALTDGRVGFEHFEDAAVTGKEVRGLLSLVRAVEHPDMPADSKEQFGAEVVVTTKGGQKLTSRIDHQIGRGVPNPMSRDELWDKFRDCASRALAEPQIQPLFEILLDLDKVGAATDLTGIMLAEAARKAGE